MIDPEIEDQAPLDVIEANERDPTRSTAPSVSESLHDH